MRAYITVNNVQVREVKPNTMLQLHCDGEVAFLYSYTHYLVLDDSGSKYYDQGIAINIRGDSYADWQSPARAGKYIFYPSSDKYTDVSVEFEVVADAVTPHPGGSNNDGSDNGGGDSGNGGTEPKPKPQTALPSWLLPAGIALLALLFLVPDKKK
jgi:hypothetical protein